MNKREAKRRVIWCVWRLLESHNNEFLDEEEDPADQDRMVEAFEDFLAELFRRGHSSVDKW